MKYAMFIGGYGENSISRVTLRDGRLRLTETFPAENASYLCLSHDERRLYAVGETNRFRGEVGGCVASYDITPAGKLIRTSVQPTRGSDPCHLTIAGNLLIVGNYTSGSLSRFRLSEDGKIAEALPLIEHKGSGPRRDRQSGAHVHQAQLTPRGELAVVDLGMDRVFFYPANTIAADSPQPVCVSVPGGFGPRHAVFPPARDTWYVLCELESQLLIYRGAPENASLIGRVSVGDASRFNQPAALRLSPNRRMLAATGRGQNNISLFAIGENGMLAKLTETPSGGDWPRDVQFTPDGKYLVCANERSSTLAAFEISDGHLDLCSVIDAPSPTCVLFTQTETEE